jgi:hypothetical protein
MDPLGKALVTRVVVKAIRLRPSRSTIHNNSAECGWKRICSRLQSSIEVPAMVSLALNDL